MTSWFRTIASAVSLCALGAWAQNMKPADLRQSIWQKLEYDRTYFQKVLELKRSGQSLSVSKDEWANEVRRATLNVPVLDKLFADKERYDKGQPVALPKNDDTYRVYFNLALMLNTVQGNEQGNYKAAVDYGSKLVIKDRKNLGVVRSDDGNYYLNLYREFFYQMATANFRLGRDPEAVKWLARIEADQDVLKLKKEVSEQQKEDPKVARLSALRSKPLAVMPLTPLTPNAPADAELSWLGSGLPEVLTNDLVQHTQLVIVERASLAKVLKEVQLSQAGITDDALAKNVGNLLHAGTLLLGSYQSQAGMVQLSLRLVDAENAQVLATTQAALDPNDVFPGARVALLNMLSAISWVDEVEKGELLSARAPKQDTLKNLLQARLLLATKSNEAKAIYAKAAKDDPAYAKLFDDLKNEFAGLSATVAVMPFVNISGSSADMVLVHGTGQALNSDLPKLGFTVVERTQLLPLIEERTVGQVLDNELARRTAEKVSADFMMLGSVLHQGQLVRIDGRFVDVKSGIVTQTVSAEGGADDFMAVLVALDQAIAKKFNEKLSEATLGQLMGKKMSREDFEKYVRQELTKESLARSLKPTAAAELSGVPVKARWPFWLAVGGVAAGAAATAVGFGLASQRQQAISYTDAYISVATRAEDQAAYAARRKQDVAALQGFNTLGGVGVGVLAASAGYLVYDTFFSSPAQPTVTTFVGATPTSAMLGVQGRF